MDVLLADSALSDSSEKLFDSSVKLFGSTYPVQLSDSSVHCLVHCC